MPDNKQNFGMSRLSVLKLALTLLGLLTLSGLSAQQVIQRGTIEAAVDQPAPPAFNEFRPAPNTGVQPFG